MVVLEPKKSNRKGRKGPDTYRDRKERKVLINNILTLRSWRLLSELCGKKDIGTASGI